MRSIIFDFDELFEDLNVVRDKFNNSKSLPMKLTNLNELEKIFNDELKWVRAVKGIVNDEFAEPDLPKNTLDKKI